MQDWGGPNNIPVGGGRTIAQIGLPSDTILMCEHWNSDEAKGGAMNASHAGLEGFMSGVQWFHFGGLIPDPTRPAVAPFPTSQNGGVSVHDSGFSNFLFCDGHVKALHPLSTVQPVNMWDASRS